MKKIGLLIISKNNYELLETWFTNYDYEDFEILNIDDGSSEDQLSLGKLITSKLKINFLNSDKPGVQNNIKQSIIFFKKLNIDWIIYQHHDSYPLTKNLNKKLQYYIDNPKINDFGVIGFNVFDSINENISEYQENKNNLLRTVSRSPLELGDGWYRIRKGSRVNYQNFDKPFAVESVMWSVAMINCTKFLDTILIDDNYQFFHAWDDIAFQFLRKNIYNIVIPDIHFAHDQSIKQKFSIPVSSANAKLKDRDHFWGHFNHHKVWERKWKFKYDLSKSKFYILKSNLPIIYKVLSRLVKYVVGKELHEFDELETIARETFKKNLKEFDNTLLVDFYNHDPKSGPLKKFDL